MCSVFVHDSQYICRAFSDLPEHVELKAEQSHGNTRCDFALSDADGNITLVEVKSAVGADYPVGQVPENRDRNGAYESAREPFQRAALFPHGSSFKPKLRVISERAIKQLNELAQLQGTEVGAAAAAAAERAHAESNALAFAEADLTDAAQEAAAKVSKRRQKQAQLATDGSIAADTPAAPGKITTAVLFVVSRADTAFFRPCHESCPLFASMLLRAQQRGVRLLAHDVVWREDGKCYAGKPLPIVFEDGVNEKIDEDWLADVLDAARVFRDGRPPEGWQPRSEYLNTRAKPRKSTAKGAAPRVASPERGDASAAAAEGAEKGAASAAAPKKRPVRRRAAADGEASAAAPAKRSRKRKREVAADNIAAAANGSGDNELAGGGSEAPPQAARRAKRKGSAQVDAPGGAVPAAEPAAAALAKASAQGSTGGKAKAVKQARSKRAGAEVAVQGGAEADAQLQSGGDAHSPAAKPAKGREKKKAVHADDCGKHSTKQPARAGGGVESGPQDSAPEVATASRGRKSERQPAKAGGMTRSESRRRARAAL